MKNKKIYYILFFGITILLVSFCLNIFFTLNMKDSYEKYLEKTEFNFDSSINDIKTSANGDGYLIDVNAVYSWEEISNTGINMTSISEEDDDYDSISFLGQGWNFSFYNTNYSKIYVSTNGWMSFTNLGDTEDWLMDIPSQDSMNVDCISLLSEDLNLDDSNFGGGDVYYNFSGTVPNRYLIIEYYQVYDYSTEELVGDFEVILYENGTIKFQYKNVNSLYRFNPIIGLDHGDMTNYNSYDATLPLTSKAISFVFNELIDVNYFLEIDEGYQYFWKVDEINHTAMERVFGSDWEYQFGFLPNMNISQIMKVNISSIIENSTHWEIKYNIWNWQNSSIFDETPNVDSVLFFRREPLNYTQELNLTNLIPLFLPKYPAVYLRNANLSDSYDDDIWYYRGTGNIEFFVYFHNLPMSEWVIGTARYNGVGVLTRISLALWVDGVDYPAFAMSLFTPSAGGGDGNDDGNGNGNKKGELDIVLIILIVSIIAIAIFAIIVVLMKKNIIHFSKDSVKRENNINE